MTGPGFGDGFSTYRYQYDGSSSSLAIGKRGFIDHAL